MATLYSSFENRINTYYSRYGISHRYSDSTHYESIYYCDYRCCDEIKKSGYLNDIEFVKLAFTPSTDNITSLFVSDDLLLIDKYIKYYKLNMKESFINKLNHRQIINYIAKREVKNVSKINNGIDNECIKKYIDMMVTTETIKQILFFRNTLYESRKYYDNDQKEFNEDQLALAKELYKFIEHIVNKYNSMRAGNTSTKYKCFESEYILPYLKMRIDNAEEELKS